MSSCVDLIVIERPDFARQLIPPCVPEREPRFLSVAEYRALRDAAQGNVRDAAIIEVLLQTGMRLSECTSLTLDNLSELPEEPAPGDSASIRVLQSRRAERIIFVNYLVCRALQRWLYVRPEVDHVGLWVSKFGGQLSARTIRKIVKTHMGSAGRECEESCVNGELLTW